MQIWYLLMPQYKENMNDSISNKKQRVKVRTNKSFFNEKRISKTESTKRGINLF